MSLVLYHNGVLSADRRTANPTAGDDSYDGLENYSKLFVSEDKTFLTGCCGYIPSPKELLALKSCLDALSNDKDAKVDLMERFVRSDAAKDFWRKHVVMFMFYAGRFLLIKKDEDLETPTASEKGLIVPTYIECDLDQTRITGSGRPAGVVLLRSGQDIPLDRFYRIVSSCCEGVSTRYDTIPLNQIKGF